MTIISLFIKELESEAAITRKMLARIPTDKLDWQPHPKSMRMGHLATHIAELPSWITLGFTTNELDFATNEYKPTVVTKTEEILEIFEKSVADGRAHLLESNAPRLNERWVLRQGDVIIWDADRWGVTRHALSQVIHHRAQLGVYLRLLGVPIPASYGPSADEQ